MNDYAQIPENVRRVAAFALLKSGREVDWGRSLEDTESLATEAGLTLFDYLGALRWIADYYDADARAPTPNTVGLLKALRIYKQVNRCLALNFTLKTR